MGVPSPFCCRTMPSGLARLEREGLLRRAEADLLDLLPVRLPPDATAPSRLVSEGRARLSALYLDSSAFVKLVVEETESAAAAGVPGQPRRPSRVTRRLPLRSAPCPSTSCSAAAPLIDGTGAPGRPADVGVIGDRITAVGDLSAVDDGDVATVIDATGRVVAPGFVDPHGHSDASVLARRRAREPPAPGLHDPAVGQLRLHARPAHAGRPRAARAGPRDARARPGVDDFADYLDAVERQPLGPNVAFLVGHGTDPRRPSSGPDDRAPAPAELAGDGRATSRRRSRPGRSASRPA